VKRDPKNLRIKVVKRFPNQTPGQRAEIRGRTIFVKKNTKRVTIDHEEGHYVLGHDTYHDPKTPQGFARQEVDATLYAYNKRKQPQRVGAQLTAIFNDITHENYNASPRVAAKALDKAINRKDIPANWKRDWRDVRKSAEKVFGNRI
jgi:hypothetical protein